MRSWLARLVSAEVRRLTAERNTARKVAVRWYRAAQAGRPLAQDQAVTNTTKESTT